MFLKVHKTFKYNIGLKTLLQQGISEPIFYGGLVLNSNELLETKF